MWSWLSFVVGIMLTTPIALIVLALIKIQPFQCHCCNSDAATVRTIAGVKYYLCSDCAREYDRLPMRGESTK